MADRVSWGYSRCSARSDSVSQTFGSFFCALVPTRFRRRPEETEPRRRNQPGPRHGTSTRARRDHGRRRELSPSVDWGLGVGRDVVGLGAREAGRGRCRVTPDGELASGVHRASSLVLGEQLAARDLLGLLRGSEIAATVVTEADEQVLKSQNPKGGCSA